MKGILRRNFIEAEKIAETFLGNEKNAANFERVVDGLLRCLGSGGRAFSCGNGGSMCDAMHFAEELTGRFRESRRALAATAISDSAHITCCANDFGYDSVFARYLEGHARAGDFLLALSVSGESANILLALEAAQKLGMFAVLLSGRGASRGEALADICLCADTQKAERAQELHIKLIHSLIESIEIELFPVG